MKRSSPTLLLSLLIANVVTATMFVIGDESIMQVLWVYWLQSVIIGVVHVVRMLSLPIRNANPGSMASGQIVRVGMAAFFALHYGFFHVVYAVFLIAFSSRGGALNFAGTSHDLQLAGGIQLGSILLSGLLFGLHHVMSFIAERKDMAQQPGSIDDLKQLFARPYIRIIPMHLIIIVGPVVAVLVGTNAVFLVFMALKTIFDVALFNRGISHPVATKTV